MRKYSDRIIQAYLMAMAGWTVFAFAYQAPYRETLADAFSVCAVVLLALAGFWWVVIMILGIEIMSLGEGMAAVRIAEKLREKLLPPGYVFALLVGAPVWNLVVKALVLFVLGPGDQGDA